MNRFTFVLLISFLSLVGCGGGGSSDSPSENASPQFVGQQTDFSIEVGASLSLSVTVSDADSSALTLDMPDAPSFINHRNQNGNFILDINPQIGDEGPYEIMLVLSDGDLNVQQTFSINVTNSNATTLVSAVQNQSLVEASEIELALPISTALQATLSDISVPPFVSVSASENIVVSIAPGLGLAGVYSASFRISDEYRSQTVSFSIEVSPYQFSPEVVLPSTWTVPEGDMAELVVLPISHVGQVSITGLSKPDFVEVVGSDDVGYSFHASPGYLDSGDYSISITLSNAVTSVEKLITLDVPQRYSGNITALSAGAFHTCAIENSKVYCWGLNDVRQANAPDDLEPAHLIAAGSYHTCAATQAGVECWGSNYRGESSAPDGLSNVSKLGAGYEHSCALIENGTVSCWGSNVRGLDNTYAGQSVVPDGLGVVSDISVGFWHTCALDDAGLHCWGDNTWGQSEVPEDLGSVSSFSAGRLITCATDENGPRCWGTPDGYGQYTLPGDVGISSRIIVGYFYNSCELSGGSLRCWGAGSTDQNTWPRYGQSIVPATLENVSLVSLGDAHACALDDNGISCWGEGSVGDDDSGYNYDQGAVPGFLHRSE